MSFADACSLSMSRFRRYSHVRNWSRRLRSAMFSCRSASIVAAGSSSNSELSAHVMTSRPLTCVFNTERQCVAAIRTPYTSYSSSAGNGMQMPNCSIVFLVNDGNAFGGSKKKRRLPSFFTSAAA